MYHTGRCLGRVSNRSLAFLRWLGGFGAPASVEIEVAQKITNNKQRKPENVERQLSVLVQISLTFKVSSFSRRLSKSTPESL